MTLNEKIQILAIDSCLSSYNSEVVKAETIHFELMKNSYIHSNNLISLSYRFPWRFKRVRN